MSTKRKPARKPAAVQAIARLGVEVAELTDEMNEIARMIAGRAELIRQITRGKVEVEIDDTHKIYDPVAGLVDGEAVSTAAQQEIGHAWNGWVAWKITATGEPLRYLSDRPGEDD